jgi:hypothetical protein
MVFTGRYVYCDYESLVATVQEYARSREVQARFVCTIISG